MCACKAELVLFSLFFAKFLKCQEHKLLIEMEMQMVNARINFHSSSSSVFRGIFYCIAKVQTSSSRERRMSSQLFAKCKVHANNVISALQMRVNSLSFFAFVYRSVNLARLAPKRSHSLPLSFTHVSHTDELYLAMPFAIMKWKCLIYISSDYFEGACERVCETVTISQGDNLKSVHSPFNENYVHIESDDDVKVVLKIMSFLKWIENQVLLRRLKGWRTIWIICLWNPFLWK